MIELSPERLLGSDALAAIVEDDGVVVAAGNQRRSVSGKIERINLVFVIAEEFRDGETPHGRLRQSHRSHLASNQYETYLGNRFSKLS